MQVHDNHYVKERLLSQESKQILTPTLSLISNILFMLKFRKELVISKGICDYIQKKLGISIRQITLINGKQNEV